MKKLALLMVGGLLLIAACVPATPGPLIPQTGSTTQPGQGSGNPGSSLTIIPPEATGTAVVNPENPQAGQGTAAAPANPQVTPQPGGTRQPVTGIPLDDPQPTDAVPTITTRVVDYDYSRFLDDVHGTAGLTFEDMGQVNEPFFNVAGRQVRLNNAEVTIFEFPDSAAHQAALDTITENGGILGAITPAWAARPNFFSKGNLIALYMGSDQATLDLLRSSFGDPLTYTEEVGGLSLDTAFRLQSRLSDRFGVGLDQIRIVDASVQEWSDSCLGLGGPAESCAQVITPGYAVTVEIAGTRYEVRTNQTGSLLRFQQQ